MILPDMHRIEGVRIVLRLVVPEDAAYIHALRKDARFNTHLSVVGGDVTDQREWINQYKMREAIGSEYYYVIERRMDQRPCGVVRLYNITADSFTWGSWILDHNKPSKAALESAVLSFSAGLERLGAGKALLDVRVLNTHATAFYPRFGATEIGRDGDNIYFELTRANFLARLTAFRQIIEALE